MIYNKTFSLHISAILISLFCIMSFCSISTANDEILIPDQDIILEDSVINTFEIMSQEDIELIALVTMAEAEGECEIGKRYVIDTILNRIDHERFPNTAYDVIYAPNQFSSMHNGRVNKCYIREDICDLVKEELISRTNTDVLFFRSGHYSSYGTPICQIEHHYFSTL